MNRARRDTNRNTLTAVPVAKARKGPSRSACAVSKPSASNGASKEDVKKLRLLPAANRDKRWSVRTCRVLPPSRRESPRDRPRVLGFGYSEITDQWLVSPLLGSTAGKPSPITSVAMFVLRSAGATRAGCRCTASPAARAAPCSPIAPRSMHGSFSRPLRQTLAASNRRSKSLYQSKISRTCH